MHTVVPSNLISSYHDVLIIGEFNETGECRVYVPATRSCTIQDRFRKARLIKYQGHSSLECSLGSLL
jgi:hypothetical protein